MTVRLTDHIIYQQDVKLSGNMHEEYEDKTISALHKVALRVIDLFDESETVYIIVDRADRTRDGGKTDHRKALLKAFVKMVEAARSKLRVFVLISGNNWQVEKHQDEMKDRLIIHKATQEYKSR